MSMVKTNTFMHTIETTNCYMDASVGVYDYLYVDSSAVPTRNFAVNRPDTHIYVNTNQLNKIIEDSSYIYSQSFRVKNSGIQN